MGEEDQTYPTGVSPVGSGVTYDITYVISTMYTPGLLGGKHISSWFWVSTMKSCRSLNSFLPIVFCEIFEKKKHMWVMAIFKNSSFIALIAIGRNTISMT